MKRFFLISKNTLRTTGGCGLCVMQNTTATVSLSLRHVQVQQPCCFPWYNNNTNNYFSSLSSSSPLDRGKGSGNRHEENDDEDIDDGDGDDGVDDDEEEKDDDDDNDYNNVGWCEKRWYQNLHRYEKHLLREQQQLQRHQPSSSSSSISHELSSSSSDEKRTRRRRLDHHFLLFPTGDSTLIAWMHKIRRKYRKGVLSKEQQEALKKTLQRVLTSGMNNTTAPAPLEQDIDAVLTRLLSPQLELRLKYWHEMYQQLCTFVQEHDGKFPYDYVIYELASIPERQLLYWCNNQRTNYKAYQAYQRQEQQQQQPDQQLHTSSSSNHNIIMQDRIQKLEALGFVWDEYDNTWHERYQELKSYQKHHGDCLVPIDYPANPQLAKWVNKQRTMYRRYCQEQQEQNYQTSRIDDTTNSTDDMPSSSRLSTMTPQRLALLQELDFCWNAQDAKWMKRYRELQEHISVNNTVYNTSASRSHCNLRGNHDVQARVAGVMMTTTTTSPTLPAGPLKWWLNKQKKRYKQYLQHHKNSTSGNTKIANQPPPSHESTFSTDTYMSNPLHQDDDDNSNDDQKILATQLTLEKRFQLLQKLGFPWE